MKEFEPEPNLGQIDMKFFKYKNSEILAIGMLILSHYKKPFYHKNYFR